MPIRVTQRMMYSDMVSQMQRSLGAYMETTEQGSTQKRINRPSDDPAGTYRVLMTRKDIASTEKYEANADAALGWLQLTDSVLSTQVPTTLTRLKELAEQASTGTYTAENRAQIASEVRELFGQLLNLANTEYEGNSIFAGHKYDGQAYTMGLGVTTWDENWQSITDSHGQVFEPPPYTIEGSSATSVMFQFVSADSSEIGQTVDISDTNVRYRWSDDGGKTWSEPTALGGSAPPTGAYTLETTTGVKITLPPFKDGTVPTELQVTYADPDAGAGATNGTLLYVHPTAIYLGDDNDTPPDVRVIGGTSMIGSANGTFSQDVLVRLDSDLPASPGGAFDYSYSTDGGSTWIPAQGSYSGSGKITFTVPGGFLEMENPNQTTTNTDLTKGTQILIHPDRANLDYEIMKDTYITVNNVGKEIFGGYAYESHPPVLINEDPANTSHLEATAHGTFAQDVMVKFEGAVTSGGAFEYSYSIDGGKNWITQTGYNGDPSAPYRLAVPGGWLEVKDPNDALAASSTSPVFTIYGKAAETEPDLFNVLGQFIAYLESNNQDGCQRTLGALESITQNVLAAAAKTGGLENRIELAKDVLSFQKVDQQERLSYTEDIDLTELLTKLTQQQITYSTVLKSTSMIMQLSLANYV
ncbi:MAG: flagellar hook-associated protein FlgL [Desulfovibrio sp.]|jgi:flagellar hook-associated protein 3 FlgL|nr:flagellar hook-associated protein FlgL [Desulfovibrio sp.]